MRIDDFEIVWFKYVHSGIFGGSVRARTVSSYGKHLSSKEEMIEFYK